MPDEGETLWHDATGVAKRSIEDDEQSAQLAWFQVGDKVLGRCRASSMGPVGTKWYPATIARVGDDGEYDLAYDDGDFEERVQVRYVKYAKLQPRPPTPPTPPTPPVKEEEEIAVQEASPTEEALPTEAEGYKLHMSTKSSTGYKGVSFANYNGVGRYKAHHANLYLNSFETAVEAAVCYAKAVKKGKCEGVVEKVADAGTEAVALSVARSACAAALVVEEQGSKGMFGRGNSRKRVSTLDAKIMWEERHEADRIRKNSRPAKEAGVADEPKTVAKRATVKPATFPGPPAPQPPMQPPLPVEPVAPQATNAMVQASVPAAMLPGSKADGTFKRPMNAFILFSNAKRAELATQNPGLSNAEVSRLLGEQWRDLHPYEKSRFVAAAKKIKEDFHQQHPEAKVAYSRARRPAKQSSPVTSPRTVVSEGLTVAPPPPRVVPMQVVAEALAPPRVTSPVVMQAPPAVTKTNFRAEAERRARAGDQAAAIAAHFGVAPHPQPPPPPQPPVAPAGVMSFDQGLFDGEELEVLFDVGMPKDDGEVDEELVLEEWDVLV